MDDTPTTTNNDAQDAQDAQDADLRSAAAAKLRQMKNVMHYVERYEQEDPHPVVPQVMDRLEAGPTGRHTLRRMNESELNDWSTAEIIFEAAKRHPLPTTDFVNLVLSTGSPIWTYSLRQMRRLFDMIDPEMDNYLSEAALEEALETDMEIRSFVQSLNNRTLSDLLSPPFETTKAAFKVIDKDQTGYVRKFIGRKTQSS